MIKEEQIEDNSSIKQKLLDLKTLGVKIVIVPSFEIDFKTGNFKLNGNESYEYKEGIVANIKYYSTKNTEEIWRINSEINKIKDASDLYIFIFKNTTEEEINKQIEVVEMCLEKFNENYTESEIFQDLSSFFKVSYNPKREIKEESSSLENAIKSSRISFSNKPAPHKKGTPVFFDEQVKKKFEETYHRFMDIDTSPEIRLNPEVDPYQQVDGIDKVKGTYYTISI